MTDPHHKIAQAIQPYLFQNGFILTDLPARDRQLLQESIQSQQLKRGEVLFRQGGFPKGAYWLISGKVKICRQMPDGQRHTLYIYSDGDLIGYRQLIAEEAHPVSAILLENATVGFIPAQTFRTLLDTSHLFSKNVLTALAREFSVWMNRMSAFGQLPVRLRMVLALLTLYQQYQQSGTVPVIVTMTRTELAEFVGTSLETVVRALNTLKSGNLVQIRGRRIVIQDPIGLLEILQRESL